jgi:hypothetical protein
MSPPLHKDRWRCSLEGDLFDPTLQGGPPSTRPRPPFTTMVAYHRISGRYITVRLLHYASQEHSSSVLLFSRLTNLIVPCHPARIAPQHISFADKSAIDVLYAHGGDAHNKSRFYSGFISDKMFISPRRPRTVVRGPLVSLAIFVGSRSHHPPKAVSRSWWRSWKNHALGSRLRAENRHATTCICFLIRCVHFGFATSN